MSTPTARRLVAGVDSSTQSTKVEVRDLLTGEVVQRGSVRHPATTPPISEQDPAAWWRAFEQAWESVGAPAVEAISIAGQQHGMVVIDAAEDVIRPAKLWNDTQSAPDAEWLVGRLSDGASGWADAVGSVPVAAFTATKLSWLHRTEPDAWERMAKVMLPHDWLTSRLTGSCTTDRGDASGTGYWSAATGAYRFDLLELIDSTRTWADAVPRVAGPYEVVGTWRGARVACGTGDNMAAALGLGLGRGEAVMSLGTSGTVYTISDHATCDPTGAVAGFADASGGFLPLACTLNATKVLDAIARLLGVEHPEFDRLALDTAAGADGVTLLPYFDGERTPNLPHARGSVHGLRSDLTRGQLARASIEGVVCGLLDALDAVRVHAPVNALVVTGGAARSPAVRSILADLCDVPVASADATEAVATGACVQAAAVALEVSHAEIVTTWGLATRVPVERTQPHLSTGSEVRDQYRQARLAAHPTSA